MARILFILPQLPQRMGAPYLGQQYVASTLLAAGHEVRALDLAAINSTGSDEEAVELVEDWGPDLVGMTLFTYNALTGYSLAGRLANKVRLLVAGGPHPTALPEEPLMNGFDVTVDGEGESTTLALARLLDGQGQLEDIPQVHFPGGKGPLRQDEVSLDALPYPHLSNPCYQNVYNALESQVVSGGLISSRGCPARCTYCANYVTGRVHRARSVDSVLGEMKALRNDYDVAHFSFWDDAFTASKQRLMALCGAVSGEPALEGTTWTCITPANMVKPAYLTRMRAAGCVAINFGIESGDLQVLKEIQKGQRPEHVIQAVRVAKQEGMLTIVNFMFGFPNEGVEQLERTLDLMNRLAEFTDFFNNRGVLVPFPGTQLYQQWCDQYELNGWWLREEMVPQEPNLWDMSPDEAQKSLEWDPTLDLDFFRYSDSVRDKIAECVRFKARHNQRRIARNVQVPGSGLRSIIE